MTIGLSYNSDLSRVQIALSGLTGIDTVRVERSTNQLLWETVRGGTEITVTAGAASLDDYEFAADAENFYRVLDVADDSVEESSSITPSLAGRVWLKSIRHPFLNRAVDVLNWGELERASRSGIFDVSGRSNPVATHDVRKSQRFVLTLVTDDLRVDLSADPITQARDLDLVLASGDTFFIHVPKGQPVPGGYVTIGDVTQDRIVRHGLQPYTFTLPCTVVAPPAPDVVGTTLTWGTVLNLYGSWSALVSANPTWADLLATVGDPEDLVVI